MIALFEDFEVYQKAHSNRMQSDKVFSLGRFLPLTVDFQVTVLDCFQTDIWAIRRHCTGDS